MPWQGPILKKYATCLLAASCSLWLLVGCSPSTPSATTPAAKPVAHLVEIPQIDANVAGTAKISASSEPSALKPWQTEYQILGGHPTFNQAVLDLANQLVEQGSTDPYQRFSLTSTIPLAADQALCQRLVATSTLEADQADATNSPEASTTADSSSSPTSSASDTAAVQTNPTEANQNLRSQTICTLGNEDRAITSLSLFLPEQLEQLTRQVAAVLAENNQLDLELIRQQDALQAVADSADLSDQSAAAKSIAALPDLFNDVVVQADASLTVIVPPGLISGAQLAVNFPEELVAEALSADGNLVFNAAQSSHPFQGPSSADDQKGNFSPIKLVEAVDCTQAKCVALTYDDGPGPQTGRLLDTLKAQNVKASFLLVGKQAAAYPDLVKREAAEGHAIGCHTWDHPQLTKLSIAQIDTQITSTIDVIQQAVPNYNVTFTRPPYGDGAFGQGNPNVLGELKKLNQAVIVWDVDTLDWKHKDPNQVQEIIKKTVHPGAIVLMHDVHNASIDAASAVIDYLRSQGYTFVTIPQLFGGQLEPGTRYFNQTNIK